MSSSDICSVIAQFLSSLEQRLEAYENTCSLFGFLCKVESLSCDEIEAAAAKLVAKYKDDLDQTLVLNLCSLQPSSLIFLKVKMIR